MCLFWCNCRESKQFHVTLCQILLTARLRSPTFTEAGPRGLPRMI